MLGLILARAGVRTTVLEKHADFLRDFRGDTVHASTLTLLDELGLGESFADLQPRWIAQLTVQLDSGSYGVADLSRLPGRHQHIALVPQWDLLNVIADVSRQEPSYELIMEAEVTDLLWDGSQVIGVTYRKDGADHSLDADLVVGCDGRSSVVRERAGLRSGTFGVPMDSLDDALQHIRRYSTGHSETIITESQRSAARFTAEVDAAAVLVNASSRFVDGGEFGFGAEIGISTQKLHARGPMGLPEMTSTKYVIIGSGQIRE